MRSTVRTYLFACLVLAALVLLRYLLTPLLGNAVPFITVFAAVAFAVWIGGLRTAIPVAIVGYIAAGVLFLPRGARIHDFTVTGAVVLLAFMLTCSVIIAFGERLRRARIRAQQEREILQVTLASIGDAVITTDTLGSVTYLNDVAESLTGWRMAEAIGRPLQQVFNIVNESSGQIVESPAARALREGVVVGLANHTLLLRRDGSKIPIDDSAAPIRDSEGVVSGCVLIFRDVSMQRQVERERAEQFLSARTLASIVETSDDAIISKSLDGIIRSWNASAERIFGYSASDAVGKHISLIIPSDRLEEEDRIIAELRAGRRVEHYVTERRRADGRRIQVSITVSPLRDAEGHIVGASKITRDITAQRAAEEEREKFVTLVESSTDFIGICDLEGAPTFINLAGLKKVGLDSVEDARRTKVTDFFFPEDRERIVREFLPAVLASGHAEIEVRFRHFKTGEALWMAYKVQTLRDASGRAIGFATVSQDMTERKRMENELRQLAANLSEADRRKNEFLATLAHELRNPLAPIGNAATTLRLAPADLGSVRAASAMIERQVGQMARLVDDLLDLSRITRGKIELRRQVVDLRPIIGQAVEANQALYRSMDHELSVSVPAVPVFASADPTRVTQIVGNLLNNACKFTERGGKVDVTLRCADGFAEIRVRDNGIGIAPERLSEVFEMFMQIDTSLQRSRDGLGIGLTLVKNLVELHGGDIVARSEGAGRGSEFIVRVPLQTGEQAPAPQSETASASSPRRILIVDDNVDAAESLAMLLRLDGHSIAVAHDGLEALEAARNHVPDTVLLDIGLPKMNGYDVCKRLREQPGGAKLFIVALTGWGQEEDRRRSVAAGFDAHLTKPVEHADLVGLMARERRS